VGAARGRRLQLCVERRAWISAPEFEDAIAVCNLLPGPASTQLAIYCASRAAGWPGAIVGGAGFILPGLTIILGPAALFLSGSSPEWARALGAGGGAAVAAVAVRAGVDLMGPSWLAAQSRRARWVAYVAAGAASAVVVGPWLVLVLLGCGFVELAIRRGRDVAGAVALLAAAPATGGWGALAWTAFKVGGLSYGGGFVIIPLMQADAVSHYHWMTSAQFLEASRSGRSRRGRSCTPSPRSATAQTA
jgi:chromate transporter